MCLGICLFVFLVSFQAAWDFGFIKLAAKHRTLFINVVNSVISNQVRFEEWWSSRRFQGVYKLEVTAQRSLLGISSQYYDCLTRLW